MANTDEKITYINEVGGTIIFQAQPPYVLLSKTGFGGSQNTVTSQKMYAMDGEIESDESLPPRSLGINALVYGKSSVEDIQLRRNLLSVFNPKLNGTLVYESYGKTYEIDVKVTEGWNETFDEKTHTYQGSVSFLALFPLWRDTSSDLYTVQLGQTTNLLKFPLEITDNYAFAIVDVGKEVTVTNPGHVSVGMEINITCTAEVINPMLLNPYTEEWFAFNYTFKSGDTIYINTNDKKRRVLINGENGFFNRKLGSKFLQISNLETNYFILKADDGVENMIADMKFYPLFTGVV